MVAKKEFLNKLFDEVTQTTADAYNKHTGQKTDFECRLDAELNTVREMLIRKNKAYGNSALDPLRIFARSDRLEGIRVRIDDKLNRLAQGKADDEDVVLDLLGYLLIYRIAQQGL